MREVCVKLSDETYARLREEAKRTNRLPFEVAGDVVEKALPALLVAHHELTTLAGLYAFDGMAPEVTWRVDTSRATQEIGRALGVSSPNG
jgi:hypothetical protein